MFQKQVMCVLVWTMVLIGAGLSLPAAALADIPAAEREALTDLYNSTDGANWTDSTNWLGDPGTECRWYGITCDAEGNHVTAIDLHKNKLVGTIPASLGDLTGLQNLFLNNDYEADETNNNQLTGSIPKELGNLTNLRGLYLFRNQLSGSIPPELGNLGNLTSLDLQYNQLSGSIPPELGNLTNMIRLYLGGNQLTGNIPPELGDLTKMMRLYLNDNQLSGSIPAALGGLTNMTHLYLGANQLSGSIPTELQKLTKLEAGELYLNSNALYTTDDALRTRLNLKQNGGDWESSQTVAPTDLLAGTPTATSVPLTWTKITYIGDTGGYEIEYSTTSGGPYTPFETTADKSVESTTITGLQPETTYYFHVRTVTQSDINNQNTVYSGYTAEVSATTVEAGPSPVITSISPNHGSISGGTNITITGENFDSATTVTIGGNPAVNLIFVSDIQVTCQVPAYATAGAADIVVTNPDGQSATRADGYTYDSDINAGLIAYYPFNGNTNDETGNGHHGTINGDPEFVDGLEGKGLKFDGDGDYIQVELVDSLKFNPNFDSFTLVAWAKPIGANNPDGPTTCDMKTVPFIDAYTYYLGNKSAVGKRNAHTHEGGVSMGSPLWDQDNWHLFVGTWDVQGTEITASYYLDGNLKDRKNFETVPDGSYPWHGLYIGATRHCSRGLAFGEFYGDEIRIYNRAISEAEIRELHSKPTLSVTPVSQNALSVSGTTTFTVTNTGRGTMAWTAESNAPWLTIDSDASGTDSGTITVSYETNTDASRTGTLTITAPGAENSPMTVEVMQSADSESNDTFWTDIPNDIPRNLNSVWSSSASNVIAVGDNGLILHYNGTDWTPMTSSTSDSLMSVWGTSADNIFALGSSGTILHYDGTAWTRMTSPTYNPLIDIWGASDNDLFAAGLTGGILHYDGNQWEKMPDGPSGAILMDIWGSSGNNLFVVGSSIFHYDGAVWTEMPAEISGSLRSVWGSSGTDVFAVGDAGTILRYDGTTWTPTESSTSETLIAVWGNSQDQVFAVSETGSVLRYDGNNTWTQTTSGTHSGLTAVCRNSGSDAFAVGQNGLTLRLSYASPPCPGGICYVAMTGSDTIGNGSRENPFDTIQYAIDTASDGHTVQVSPGVYEETLDFKGKKIRLVSQFPETGDADYISQTIIQGDGTGPVVTFANGETADTALSSLTLTNGTDGIRCDNTSPVLTNMVITGNSNTGISCDNASGPRLTNVTITKNGTAGIASAGDSDPVLINSIVWDNPQSVQGTATATYSDIQGGFAGEGNTDADPMFIAPGNGNFRLGKSSPCINTGTCDGINPCDFEGVSPDMGAFEVEDDGLVAYYPFDGNANDQSGYGNTGTEIGETRYVEGATGQARDMDKLDGYEYIQIPNTLNNTEYSITLWIKLRDMTALNSLLMLNQTESWENSDFFLGVDSEPRGLFVLQAGTDLRHGAYEDIFNESEELKQDILYFIVCTYKNGMLTIYLDGEIYAEYPGVSPIPDTAGDTISIGISPNGEGRYQLDGFTDELRIYNRAISEAEIHEIYGTLYVDSEFVGTSTGKPAAPYTTLTQAVINAPPGRTIRADHGIYPESLTLTTHGLKLKGGWQYVDGVWIQDEELDPGLTEIKPDDGSPGITIDQTDGVMIEGFALGNGVYAKNSRNLRLISNITIGMTSVRIEASEALLAGNEIIGISENSDAGQGVIVTDSTADMERNFIQAETLSIHYKGSSDGAIIGNSIYMNNITASACGIKLETAADDTVRIESNVLYFQGSDLIGIKEVGTTATPETLIENQFFADETFIFYHDENPAADIKDCDQLNDGTLGDVSDWYANYCYMLEIYVPCEPTDDEPCIEIVDIPMPLRGDKDRDGIPDDWEHYYFGDTTSHNGPEDDEVHNEGNEGENAGAEDEAEDEEQDAGGDNGDEPDEPLIGDGLTVSEEYRNHTNPNKWDTDGDGIPDGWEVRNGLDPLEKDDGQDDGSDPDGDGYPNLSEYRCGTDPTDSASYCVFEPNEGVFRTGGDPDAGDETAVVAFNLLFDGGMYEGEVGIFSISGLEEFAGNLIRFIAEVVRRVTSGSTEGHITFSDREEGAQFAGALGESDQNHGSHGGVKYFEMAAGDQFGVILIPNCTFEEIAEDPSLMETRPGCRPFFSFRSPNSDFGVHVSRISDVNGLGTAFVYEDQDTVDGDRDYNDLIFQVGEVRGDSPVFMPLVDEKVGEIPLLNGRIDPDRDWRVVQNPEDPEDAGLLGEMIMGHTTVAPVEAETLWMSVSLGSLSPAVLSVYDPDERECGKDGGYIPGAVFAIDNDGNQKISLPALEPGTYRIVLRGRDEGGNCLVTVKGHQGEADILMTEERDAEIGAYQLLKAEIVVSDDLTITSIGELESSAKPDGTILTKDITGDGRINSDDTKKVALAWQKDACEGDSDYDPFYDLDQSGCIKYADISKLLKAWYDPPPEPEASSAPEEGTAESSASSASGSDEAAGSEASE